MGDTEATSEPAASRPPVLTGDTTKPRRSVTSPSRVTSLRIRSLDEQAVKMRLSFRHKLMLAFGLSTLVVGALTFVGVRQRFRTEMLAAAAVELAATRRVFENLVDAQFTHLESAGQLIGDAPRLRAAIETDDPSTVAEESAWFRTTGQADLLAVFNARGKPMSFDVTGDRVPAPPRPPDALCMPDVKEALAGKIARGLLDHGGRLYMTVSVPVKMQAQVTGVVLIGHALADRLARQIHGITNVQVAFVSGGQLRASSLDEKTYREVLAQMPVATKPAPAVCPAPAATRGAESAGTVALGGQQQVYLVGQFAPSKEAPAMHYLLLLSLADRELAERHIENTMLMGGAACLVVLLLISGQVSRRLTRGIRQLVDAANQMARGDFESPITVTAGDEIGYLAHTMMELRGSVAEQMRKLNRMNENLRGKIEEILFNETLGTQYDKVSILGRGGMGIVYRAHNTDRDCTVAIKVLSPMLAEVPSVVTRFMREGEILQRLEHPALIRTFNVDHTKLPYCEMEYFEGQSLAHVVKEFGPLSWTRARSIIDRVLSALAYCHGAGVIHRDVKPSNILLGPGDALRLIDFGLARDESLTALTHSREAFGTPDYSAPEQERGQDVDVRADVYSAGQTLHYLLAGQVAKLRSGGFVSVRERRPADLPDPPPVGIDRVMEQALAYEPNDRFESCEAFRQALERL